MKKQLELLLALRKELVIKQKELADQKWVFEQFLKSPSWRLTAPIRWAANRLRSLRNGSAAGTPVSLPKEPEPPEETELIAGAGEELKAAFTSFFQVGLETFLVSGTTLDLPQSSKPVISIVLVLYNRAELTLACLRSIVEQHNEEIEVVIVDNASSDQTSHLLDRLKGARIIRNSDNRHFLAGVNQATAECRGEYILLLNNDAQLLPGALQSALGTLRSSADIGAVGGRIILLDGTLQEAGSVIWQNGSCLGYGRGDNPFAPMYRFRRDVDYCSGAFLLTPREIWEKLKGFDTAFAPAYYEETDYCMRLWALGLRVVYEPGAAIVHYEFASSKSSAAKDLQARHQTFFAERHRKALAGRELASPEALLRARSRNADRRILIIDDRVPHLWLGAGFPRANSLVRSLLKQGYFVTLYPMADAIQEAWDTAYVDFPSEVEIMLGMGRELLEAFLRTRRDYYSAVIVSRPHNMRCVALLLNEHPDWFENIHLIYDAEALFAARDIGRRRLAGNPMTDEEILNAFGAEVRLTKAADQVVAVSLSDREAFRRHGIERVEVLGHSLEITPGQASFDSRSGLLFVGAIHQDLSPNADSLIWFLKDVYPRICRQLGQVPVTIAGVNQSEAVRALVESPVRITGYVPSLQGLYSESRVFIAPTRYAAGVPHKVHEAAAHGLPVVATPLLADQLGWSKHEIAIAGDAEAFAAACVEVYTNSAEWSRLREAALERVRLECSPQVFEETLRRILSNSS